MVTMKGENGVYLTQGLFYEFNNQEAPYTLRDTGKKSHYVAQSGKRYLSVPHVYRNCIDEYEAAMELLGSWEHWKKLCSNKWFMEGKDSLSGLVDWREEKVIQDKMLAKKALLEAIEDGNVAAAKLLYETTNKKTVGRPEKTKPEAKKSSVTSLAAEIRKRSL